VRARSRSSFERPPSRRPVREWLAAGSIAMGSGLLGARVT
jgi:hypothetical protein